MERDWPTQPYVRPQDRFTVLCWPGLFYCSGYSTETNEEFIVAIEYKDRLELYRYGPDEKNRGEQYRKYTLYKVSYEVHWSYLLSGEKLGEYDSLGEVQSAVKSLFPGHRMTAQPKDAPWEDGTPPPPAPEGSERDGCLGCLIIIGLIGLMIEAVGELLGL